MGFIEFHAEIQQPDRDSTADHAFVPSGTSAFSFNGAMKYPPWHLVGPEGRIVNGLRKTGLAEVLNEYLDPLRKRRAEYMSHPDDLKQIVRLGKEKVAPVAHETLEEVEHKMGLHTPIGLQVA